MRPLAHVISAFVFLALLGGVWRVTPFEVVIPDVGLVFALYLGVTARSRAVEAVAAAWAIGYLADVLSGAPRGLHALVFGVICLLGRLVSARLLLRGTVIIGVFTLVWALAEAAAILAVRVGFDAAGPLGHDLLAGVGSALCTATVSPLVFGYCRRLDAKFARTAREREAAREGWG